MCQCISSVHSSSFYFLLTLPFIRFYPNIALASVPYFHSVIFPLLFQFGPYIMMGYVILILEFHHSSADFMSICSLFVSDVAKLIFLLYIHFLVVVFSSPLTSFHLYSCSLHSYLWRDLRFGNVILVHQCIPMLY